MKKNIVMITVDSLRNDFYNPKIYNYKFLSKIKNQSTYFSNCFSLGDDTGTTFPQFLSSTYLNLIPYEKHDKRFETNRMCRIEKPRISIAETLKGEGYNTYSYQTSPNLSPFFGYDKGFDIYEYLNPFSGSNLPFFIKYWYKPSYADAEHVISSIEKQELKPPFFLWVHLNDVHEPYYSLRYPKFMTDFLWSKFTSRPTYSNLSNLQINPSNSNMIKVFRKLYKDKVEYLDEKLYSLFANSKQINIDEDIFVLTADHGQSLGEYNQWGHGYRVLPTRESSNVPLFISEPSQKVGTEDRRFCSTMDIVPTILEILKLPLLDIYDGQSLRNKLERSSALVWSNSLDFKNGLYSLRIFDEPYIFWKDDFNFKESRLFQITDKKIVFCHDPILKKKYESLSSKHIENIRRKQKKYAYERDNESIEKEVSKEVMEALKAMGYA